MLPNPTSKIIMLFRPDLLDCEQPTLSVSIFEISPDCTLQASKFLFQILNNFNKTNLEQNLYLKGSEVIKCKIYHYFLVKE